ncbi:hypothetical protein A9F13_13g01782 [Clavispora lusitaniae]|uniref:Uncharacterized protein n=1 Tax=Clavispora lusitaniae TaxID=36911 RepID=A0AA91PXR1_CLALS|nr:hypothetical protein A9F13_13g01782 [Clavispora lusitaniae]
MPTAVNVPATFPEESKNDLEPRCAVSRASCDASWVMYRVDTEAPLVVTTIVRTLMEMIGEGVELEAELEVGSELELGLGLGLESDSVEELAVELELELELELESDFVKESELKLEVKLELVLELVSELELELVEVEVALDSSIERAAELASRLKAELDALAGCRLAIKSSASFCPSALVPMVSLGVWSTTYPYTPSPPHCSWSLYPGHPVLHSSKETVSSGTSLAHQQS